MIIRYFRLRRARQQQGLARLKRALQHMEQAEAKMWKMYIIEPDSRLAAKMVLELGSMGRKIRCAEKEMEALA